jgi:GT2 family glycosyltransferase
VLPASLDSLLAQTYGDFELIISDDCSTDTTAQICRDYERRDSRVKYFCNATNLKMPGNLNAAIGRATGTTSPTSMTATCSRPDLIALWKAALDAQPRPASCSTSTTRSTGRADPRSTALRSRTTPTRTRSLALLPHVHFVRLGTVMVRREAYAAVGPFNPEYGFISDVDMWLRLSRDRESLRRRAADHDHAARARSPYEFVHWRLWFWTFAMYTAHLELYRDVLPREVADYPRALSATPPRAAAPLSADLPQASPLRPPPRGSRDMARLVRSAAALARPRDRARERRARVVLARAVAAHREPGRVRPMSSPFPLACPSDRSILERDGTGAAYLCRSCGGRYPIEAAWCASSRRTIRSTRGSISPTTRSRGSRAGTIGRGTCRCG